MVGVTEATAHHPATTRQYFEIPSFGEGQVSGGPVLICCVTPL